MQQASLFVFSALGPQFIGIAGLAGIVGPERLTGLAAERIVLFREGRETENMPPIRLDAEETAEQVILMRGSPPTSPPASSPAVGSC
jgi:hypothetical protein